MKRTALLALCLLPFSSAYAASFDCSKAAHPTEKWICADSALSKRDEALATAYKAQLALALNKQRVTHEQRNFVKALRSECLDSACVAARYDARIAALKAPFTETYMYNYKTADAYDVTITDHTKNGFTFTSRHYYLDTPEESICAMKGSRIAKHIGGGKAQFKEGNCSITFTPDAKSTTNGAWMNIEASSCDDLCVYSGLGGRYEATE